MGLCVFESKMKKARHTPHARFSGQKSGENLDFVSVGLKLFDLEENINLKICGCFWGCLYPNAILRLGKECSRTLRSHDDLTSMRITWFWACRWKRFVRNPRARKKLASCYK